MWLSCGKTGHFLFCFLIIKIHLNYIYIQIISTRSTYLQIIFKKWNKFFSKPTGIEIRGQNQFYIIYKFISPEMVETTSFPANVTWSSLFLHKPIANIHSYFHESSILMCWTAIHISFFQLQQMQTCQKLNVFESNT